MTFILIRLAARRSKQNCGLPAIWRLGPDDETWFSGTVVEFEPEKSLILSWLEENSGWLNPARLVITLAPIATGTHVTLIHDGFENIGRSDWLETVQDYEYGADLHRILDRLADLVSRRCRQAIGMPYSGSWPIRCAGLSSISWSSAAP
jgi:Activator of Hsp90 ATPase homolog 1-like protein